MLELSRRNSPDSSSSFVTALSTRTSSSNISASSSPLVSDEERVLQRVESWWTGGNSQVPLPSTHPRYHQACHSCHRLGHYRNQCPVYQCPHCTRWAPGHNPNRCPLRRRTPQSSSSSSPNTSRRSSGSSRRSPIPTPPPRRSHSPYPRPWRPRNRNCSPISCQDDIDLYEDISGDGIIDSICRMEQHYGLPLRFGVWVLLNLRRSLRDNGGVMLRFLFSSLHRSSSDSLSVGLTSYHPTRMSYT